MDTFELNFHKVADITASHFTRPEPRNRALQYVRALADPEVRKTANGIANSLGEKRADGLQRMLSSAAWDADAVRDALQAHLLGGSAGNVRVFGAAEYNFIKKGASSVGVGPQYSRRTGRLENCQTGLFVVQTGNGADLIADRELYLPEFWLKDKLKCCRTKIPHTVRYRSKEESIMAMMRRIKQIRWYCDDWFVCTEPLDGKQLATSLEHDEIPYVLQQPNCLQQLRMAGVSMDLLTRPSWTQWVEKGAVHSQWLRIRIPDSEVRPMRRWLLVERVLPRRSDKLRTYRCFGPEHTDLETLVAVALNGGSAARTLAAACESVGLDAYEVRQWPSWYRHITLAMLAHFCLNSAPATAQPAKPA
ncbi:IS701 family transposase [Nocardia iowensis]